MWNRDKWACPSRFGVLPPDQKCAVAALKEMLSTGAKPGLHLVEWVSYNVDPSRSATAHTVRQSGLRGELSRSLGSLEFKCYMHSGQKTGFLNSL